MVESQHGISIQEIKISENLEDTMINILQKNSMKHIESIF
jgi:hypothetical protein